MKNNKTTTHDIIIIGGDHHNTLSVVRSFGRKKLNYKILIHSKERKKESLMIYHSRFGKQLYIVNDDESAIINWLIEHKSKQKIVIIACSDLAELSIDNNYEKLSCYYYISGFSNQPGMVVKMMNKYNQKIWATDNKIKMAKSWEVDLSNNHKIPKDIEYPCIVKPNISAYGKKADISICNNSNELDKTINDFISKEYKEIIIQKFINKKYEVCALGAIINSKLKNVGAVIKKDRENPPTGGGSLTFAHFIDDERINNIVSSVINALYENHYRGLYDIEFFVCDDDVYLNEINFRNSGNNYALIKNGIDAPYLYYLDTINEKINNAKIKKTNMYFMDEINEYILVKKKFINHLTFLKEFKKANSYAKIDIGDLGITLFLIKKLIRGKLRND